MGMFDTIFMRVKCPRCHRNRPWELQTKDLGQNLGIYNQDSIVELYSPFISIEAVGNCPICQKYVEMVIPIIDKHFGTPTNFS
jgi:hypothetical protein